MLLAMEAVSNGTPIKCTGRLHGVPHFEIKCPAKLNKVEAWTLPLPELC